MKKLPDDVRSYTRTKMFDQDTIPQPLLKDHSTAEHSWAIIHMVSGELKYIIGENDTYILEPGCNGVIEPNVLHHIKPLGQVEFFIEFYK